MNSRWRWAVAFLSLALLALGLAVAGTLLVYAVIPLRVSPEGYTLDELRDVGAAFRLTPVGLAVWPGPMVAWGMVLGVRAFIPSHKRTLPRAIGIAILVLGAIVVWSFGEQWGAGFAAADYFAGAQEPTTWFEYGYVLVGIVLVGVGLCFMIATRPVSTTQLAASAS